MDSKYILKKDHLTSFLRKLKKEFDLVAPVKNRHGDTIFQPVEQLDEVEIDLEGQAQNSLKQFLFPQQEVLFRYTAMPDAYAFEPVYQRPNPTVYFAVKSCDLNAVLYMDVIFLQGRKDHHYLEKRKNAVLIGINCNTPQDNCFCNAMKSGPFLDYGYDLQFTELGDRFLVETGRVRGEELVRKWYQFFAPATEEDVKAQYQAFLEARGRYKLQVHADQAIKRLADNQVPDAIWHELSLRCQDCAGCAYICPTCTCFTIADKKISGQEGERLRAWDACTFAGFTRMAGGHNPVTQKTHAIHQRFMHKLCYDVRKHGRASCVGCGRCVDMCFGGTDIVRFINMAGEG